MTEEDKPGITRRRVVSSRRLIQPKPTASGNHPASLANLPLRTDETSAQGSSPRFHFFLIDCGWDGPAPEVIRNNLEMITQFQNHDPLFILTREQSRQILKKHPHLIGKDPILLARDLQAGKTSGESEYHGFHLNLGLIRDPNQVLVALRKFLHLLATHRQSVDIEREVKAQLHRKGITGAIEVLRVSAEAMAG
jgi:hypothetical protein